MTLTLLTLVLQGGSRGAGSAVPAWIILVTALAAPAVAAVTLYFTNRREANKLDHELHLEQRKERIKAYLKMAVAARNLGQVEKKDPKEPGGKADLVEALAEIKLVARTPEILAAADNLSQLCVGARSAAAAVYNRSGTTRDDVLADKKVEEAADAAESARSHFLVEARKDVGLPAIGAKHLLG